MPTLGAPLDLAKYEARNLRAHQLGTAPSSPVTGQLYYNTADNTLYWWNGTAWISASGSTVPDATASVKGIVQLAGDLTGTAASPQIAAGAVTDAEVAAANKDGVAATPSLRTLGTGSQQAMKGDTHLNQILQPLGAVNMGGFRLAVLADPTFFDDAATKQYVDGVAQGLDVKTSVKAATTANITLSGTQTIDGVALVANDRCLVKNQTTQSANGIYSVQSGAWTRVADMDVWTEVPGAFVFVEQGTVLSDTGWVCTADQGGTLGTTNITWSQFSGAGEYTWGAGLLATGNTVDIGSGPGITVNADSIQVANNGITNAMVADGVVDLATPDVTGILTILRGGTNATSPGVARFNLAAAGYYTNFATHGAGTTITITAATHGLRAQRGLIVQVQDNATGNVLLPDVSVAANGDVTVTFGVSQAANTILVTVVG
jgi:Repeat of unknown function (DUF5907)